MTQEQLIQFNFAKSQSGKDVISARELHSKLQIETRFADWFPRMCDYGFKDKEDYCQIVSSVVNQQNEVLLKNEKNPKGGRPSTDYAITIDMAKQLCMIQRTDIGKKCREYFIACEKQIQEQKALAIPSYQIADEIERAQRWIEEQQTARKALAQANSTISNQSEIISKQAKVIAEQKAKADYYDESMQSTSTFTATQMAKEFGMSAVTLNRELERRGIMFRQRGQLLLSARYANKGYTSTNEYPYKNKKGERCTRIYTVWTSKGREFLINKFKN